jgi:hypothetical protein
MVKRGVSYFRASYIREYKIIEGLSLKHHGRSRYLWFERYGTKSSIKETGTSANLIFRRTCISTTDLGQNPLKNY